MFSFDAILAGLLVVALYLALTTRPTRSACETPFSFILSSHHLGLKITDSTGFDVYAEPYVPYLTLRCEWMMRLASSGVSSSTEIGWSGSADSVMAPATR